jgi:hypothetical protein
MSRCRTSETISKGALNMATKKSNASKAKGQSGSANSTVRRGPKAKAPAATKKLSALDAAARVLGEKREPMTCPELIEAMATKGYWKSPGGKTPAATLYSALKREIATKQGESRFQQNGPGKFALA